MDTKKQVIELKGRVKKLEVRVDKVEKEVIGYLTTIHKETIKNKLWIKTGFIIAVVLLLAILGSL